MAYESYADATFYTSTFVANTGATPEATITTPILTQLLFKASRIVDKLTLNKAKDQSEMTAEQVTSIKYAVCAQAEFEYLNGDSYKESFSEGENGFSLGKFSYNNGASTKVEDVRKADKVSPEARDYLRDYGLTYRGADTLIETILDE